MTSYLFDPLVQITDLQSELIFDLDLSNDGSLLAAACVADHGSAPIRVFRTADMQLVNEIGRGFRVGNGAAFSGEGSLLYSLVRRDDLRFDFSCTDLKDGSSRLLSTYGDAEYCHSLERSQDGRFVAVVGSAVEIWDMKAEKVVRFREGANRRRPIQAALSADGAVLCVYGIAESKISLIDLESGESLGELDAPGAFGKQVLAAGSVLLAAAEGDRGVFLYELQTKKRLFPEIFHENEVNSQAAFSPDGKFLVNYGVILTGFDLVSGEFLFGSETGLAGRVTAAACCYGAPMAAFAVNSSICLAKLVQG